MGSRCRDFILRLSFSILVSLPASALYAQSRFPIKYLDEVGHFGIQDSRTSADLGVAQVFLDSEDVLRFEGIDKAGKPWRLWIERYGGVGATDVWTADFDANGQPDLLITSHGGRNGRCVDGAYITALLFQSNGRPVPWRTETYTTAEGKNFAFPPLLMDQNGDGRAEFVITGCGYSDPGKNNHVGEDRWIEGVYEARSARMVPVRNSPLRPYSREVRQLHPSNARFPGFITWVATNPAKWADQLSGLESTATLKLTALFPGAQNCDSVPPMKNNSRAEVNRWSHRCEELHHPHALFSDGRSRMFDVEGDKDAWRPWVVIDGPAGRDIYLVGVKEARNRILNEGYALKLLGDDSEPSWIWAETTR